MKKCIVFFLLLTAHALPAIAQDPDTPGDQSQAITAGGVSFVFATAKQAKALLQQPDLYTDQWSQFDRQVRIRSELDPGTKGLLQFVGEQALDWPDEERQWATSAIQSLAKPLEELGIQVEEPIMLLHTTGREESGAAYTRGNFIAAPKGQLGSKAKPPRKLMAHELFHVLSRNNPKLRDELYATIGFQRASQIDLPQQLQPLKITNPDAPIIEHVIDIKLDEDTSVSAAPVLFAKSPFSAKTNAGLFSYLSFQLMEVEQMGDRWQPKLVDSKPVFHSPANPDFRRQIGQNTRYIIHPEEVLADNFALMLMGSPVKDRWVTDAMTQALRKHVSSTQPEAVESEATNR
ncbi:MAG: eCIS core domain-containing protein [Rubripirellula sp.]